MPKEVVVDNPGREEVFVTAEETGRVEAKYSVDVIARVPGFLFKKFFKEGDFVKKGELINVVGKLKASQYEDKNGNKVNSFSIIADNVKKTVIVKGEKKENQETVPTEQTVYPTEKVDYTDLDPIYDSEAVPF